MEFDFDFKSIEPVLIPEYQDEFLAIKNCLLEAKYLGMILIDASTLNNIEHYYGKNIYSQVMNEFKRIVLDMRGKQIRRDDIITINHADGDQFYIFLSKKRQDRNFQSTDIENMVGRLNIYLNEKIFMTTYPLIKKRSYLRLGHAVVIYNALIDEKKQLEKLIDDARLMANYLQFRELMRHKEKLQEIILKEEIHTHYQPVVILDTNEVIGYEALSRGPKNSEYENPYVLFYIAEETGILFDLDSICRRLAFINAKGIPKDMKLFVNMFPTNIQDPEFRDSFLKNFLIDLEISPRKVVIEVSEKQAIENFLVFNQVSKYFTDLGFAIAVDDTSIRYINLKSLLDLKLDYIKIDISLITNICIDKIKQEMVREIVKISGDVGAEVIAEGIETIEDLKFLIKLGVKYGQGFLFAKPAPAFPSVQIIKI